MQYTRLANPVEGIEVGYAATREAYKAKGFTETMQSFLAGRQTANYWSNTMDQMFDQPQERAQAYAEGIADALWHIAGLFDLANIQDKES